MATLIACTRPQLVSCPIEIPDLWRHPDYVALKTGFYSINGERCLTDPDAKAMIRNQMICDEYLKDIIELFDAVK